MLQNLKFLSFCGLATGSINIWEYSNENISNCWGFYYIFNV